MSPDRPVEAPSTSLFLRVLAVLAATAIVVLPGNYAVLHGPFAVALRAAMLLSTALLVLVLVAGSRRSSWHASAYLSVLALIVLAAVSASSSAALASNLRAIAPILGGMGTVGILGRQRSLRLVGVLSVALMAALLLDAVVGDYVTLRAMGVPRHSIDISVGLRARGFIGQPVPAAVFQVTAGILGLFCVMRRTDSRSHVVRAAAVSIGLGGALLAGTRSALILFALGFLLLAAAARTRRRSISPWTAVALPFTLAAGTALLASVPASSFGRVLSFGDLGRTDSFSNRLRAFEFLEHWTTEPWPERLVGHGARALQTTLQGGTVNNGISTVDNMAVTVLWDFGVLGLALLLVVTFRTLRGVLSRDSTVLERAAAAALTTLLLSSLFFDTFYTAPLAFVAGLLWSCRYPSRESLPNRGTGGTARHGGAAPISAPA